MSASRLVERLGRRVLQLLDLDDLVAARRAQHRRHAAGLQARDRLLQLVGQVALARAGRPGRRWPSSRIRIVGGQARERLAGDDLRAHVLGLGLRRVVLRDVDALGGRPGTSIGDLAQRDLRHGAELVLVRVVVAP